MPGAAVRGATCSRGMPRSPAGSGRAGCAELPLILHSLAQARDALLALLGSPDLDSMLAAASLAVALRERSDSRVRAGERGKDAARTRAGAPGKGSSPHEQALRSRPARRLPGPEHGPPPSERQLVERAFDSLSGRLRSAGCTPRRRMRSRTSCWMSSLPMLRMRPGSSMPSPPAGTSPARRAADRRTVTVPGTAWGAVRHGGHAGGGYASE